ncbi:threonine/serine exporter family protein [Microbacterium sp. ARD32]|uniref:threonine/serine exporter family protein n=1 Tax=Microbacterium sp. ARD32 TaxID=2962577 RepID=UPI0028820248|nr:threonine/serine exporter family protein [Microbacterium sp. ARD32]MDT0158718.1 threonine/serine exporter family protein [Microbacterium sp. ARD32]
MAARKGWRVRLAEAIHVDASSRPMTEAILSIDEMHARRVIELAMRIAEALIAVGAAANEVVLSATRVTAAFGIRPVHVDITFNSIAVSYHGGESDLPFTLIRVVRAPVPDHAKLQQLQALVADIEAGLDLTEARLRFHVVRRTPFRYRPAVIVAAQGLLAVGVCLLYGASWLTTLVALLAACGAALVQRWTGRMHLPFFFSQAAGALVVTAFAAVTNVLRTHGVAVFEDASPGLIVAAGIVLMLAGMSVVAAAQDAIDGFALTAGGRILDLALLTLGVVIGIVGGVALARRLGAGFPLSTDPPTLGPAAMQMAGVVLIAVTVAVWNGATARTILVSALLGGIAWAGFSAAVAGDIGVPLASALGALAASFIGTLMAHRLHVPSIAVTTAAIVPMVPGSVVYRGLLAIVGAEGDTVQLIQGFSELFHAGAIGLALASGASLGLVLGAPVRDTLQSVVRRRGRIR